MSRGLQHASGGRTTRVALTNFPADLLSPLFSHDSPEPLRTAKKSPAGKWSWFDAVVERSQSDIVVDPSAPPRSQIAVRVLASGRRKI